MDVCVNTGHMKYVSRDMDDLTDIAEKLWSELDDIGRVLKRQSELEEYFLLLENAKNNLEKEKSELDTLAQTLEMISMVYDRTEDMVENSFLLSLKWR